MPTNNDRHSFNGVDDRIYTLAVNPASIERVEKRLDFDLLSIASSPIATELAKHPNFIASILYLLASPEESPAEFGKNISDAEAFPAAVDAMLAAIVDYLPRRHRNALKPAIAG